LKGSERERGRRGRGDKAVFVAPINDSKNQKGSGEKEEKKRKRKEEYQEGERRRIHQYLPSSPEAAWIGEERI